MRWHRLWGIVVVCICSWYPKTCVSVRDQGHGEWFRRGGVGKKKACLGGGVSIENPGVHPTSVWVFQLVVSLRLSWMYRQWMIQARVRFLPSLSHSLTRDFRPSSHGSSSTIRPVNSSRRRGTRYNVSHIPGCWCSAVPDLSGRWAARKSVSSTAGRSFHLIRASLLSNQHQRTSIVVDVHRTSFTPVPSTKSRRRWSDRTKGFLPPGGCRELELHGKG